jgi:hypothetical protein
MVHTCICLLCKIVFMCKIFNKKKLKKKHGGKCPDVIYIYTCVCVCVCVCVRVIYSIHISFLSGQWVSWDPICNGKNTLSCPSGRLPTLLWGSFGARPLLSIEVLHVEIAQILGSQASRKDHGGPSWDPHFYSVFQLYWPRFWARPQC